MRLPEYYESQSNYLQLFRLMKIYYNQPLYMRINMQIFKSNQLLLISIILYAMDPSQQPSQQFLQPEQMLLSWITTYPQFEATTDLSELSDCRFFIHLLSYLKGMEIPESINSMKASVSLHSKVLTVKQIAKFLEEYHQTIVKKDITSVTINYVELAMGSKIQIITFLMVIISGIRVYPSSRQALMRKMEGLSVEEKGVCQILLSKCDNLGVSISERTQRSSEKKIICKFQNLQAQIDELQMYNKILKQNCGAYLQSINCLTQDKEDLQKQIKDLINDHSNLQKLYDSVQHRMQHQQIESTTIKKKYEMVRKKLQEKNAKLNEEYELYQQEKQRNQQYIEKLTKITEINEEIKENNRQLRETVDRLTDQLKYWKQRQKELRVENKEMKVKLGQYEIMIENHQLANHTQLKRKDNSQCIDENVYRLKQSLGWFQRQHNCEIRTITQRSQEEDYQSSLLNDLKQNNSFVVNQDLANVSFSQWKHQKYVGHQFGNVELTQSIVPSESQNLMKYCEGNCENGISKAEHKLVIDLLVGVIDELYSHLREARKIVKQQLKKPSSSSQRFKIFAQKVEEMFKK